MSTQQAVSYNNNNKEIPFEGENVASVREQKEPFLTYIPVSTKMQYQVTPASISKKAKEALLADNVYELENFH